VAKRLPEHPLDVAKLLPGLEPGRHGGEMTTLLGRSQDVRMMVVFGYARLVTFTAKLDIVPDIIESLDNDGDRVFTFHLRKGHRWSDGAPFTSEDFRYYWEDVANDKNLSPFGPTKDLFVADKPPKVEIIDELTVRYSWPTPNPYFLPRLAGASPLYIYRPAHYLRKFHAKYADKTELAEAVKKAGMRNWGQYHNRLDNMYRNDNPELPTLDPWMIRTRPPAERFVFERNPYFHRVDAQGRQLPYIDRLATTIAEPKLIPLKTSAGESDLQARNISFNNYTFLRQAAKRNNFDVHLWSTAKGSHVALYPNLNAADPVWRELNRDVRFRRALSLAINRREINQVVYFGLAVEGANTVLPQSPLYRAEYRGASARYDIATANHLLDEIGLTKRDRRGVRLLPDGRPLEIIVETAGEDTEQTDVLELIHDTWLQAGIKLYSKPSQREVLRNRVFSGQTVMTMWFGLENGIPTAQMSPEELAPTSQQQLQWPKWGQFIETGGASGEEVDDPVAKELSVLIERWRTTTSIGVRAETWARMLSLQAQQVYTIGIVADVRQPVVVSNRLRNVPKEAIYNWDPGAFFGIYRPDAFWFADIQQAEGSK
jgi:peptide/nickel transport system substrate-binding protein